MKGKHWEDPELHDIELEGMLRRHGSKELPDMRMRRNKGESQPIDYFEQEHYMLEGEPKILKKKPTLLEDLVPFFDVDYSIPKQNTLLEAFDEVDQIPPKKPSRKRSD